MPALPRPDLAPGPHRDLVDALHDLHHEAGWPSLRTLGDAAGCSRTTVSRAFSAPRLPTWGVVELLVEAMGGDPAHFHGLWLAAGTPEGATGIAPGIAGRKHELAVVRAHLESGSGLLLVTGEAGIGKTKLVETARARTEWFVAGGAGLPLSVEVPFLPVSHALQEIHRAGDDWLNQALAACPAYVRGAIASLLPELTNDEDPPPGPDASARSRLFKAVGTLLAELADRRPLAVLIDDLHWADGDTLDLVEQLLSTDVGVPLLGTFRTDDPAVPDRVTAWSARVRRLRNVETLELAPLSRAETGDQIRLLHATGAASADVTEAIADRVYARSQGQPLFTEQLAVRPDGPLPRLLDDVLAQRVADLSPDEHRVVTVLAVADRALAVDLLQSATGLLATALTPCLRALADRRLLAEDLNTAALRHPLLGEAVRRHLVPGEAADVHRRLAATLAETGEPAEVAAHWQGASDAEEELGWRIRAARAAHARIAPREEARQWHRALDLWPDGDLTERDGLRRIDAAVAQLDALEDSGQTQQAWGLIAPVLERVHALPAVAAAGVLYRASAYADLVTGALPALEYAERAVALYGDEPPSQSVVRALSEYAYCLRFAGRVTEALEADRRLLAVCRSLGDATELRHALVTYAAHLSHLGWTADIRALLDEAHRIETAAPDPTGDVFIGLIETDLVLRFGGGPEALLAAGRGGLAAVDEWHLDTYRAYGLRCNVAVGLLRAGRVAEAAELVDTVIEDAPYVEAWMLHAARIALDTVRGQLEEATTRWEALQLGSTAASEEREVTAIVTPCELWSGRPDLALERLSRALEDEVGSADRIMTGECQVLAVRAAADLAASRGAERLDLRRQMVGLLSDDATDIACEAQRAYRAARTAELSRLAADQRPDLWIASANEWDAIGRPFESAYAYWRGAQATLPAGRGTSAHRLLQRAAKQAQGHVPLTGAIRTTQRNLTPHPTETRR